MNMLNSLILEGIITDDLSVYKMYKGIQGEFTLETKSSYKNYNGEKVEETSNITVYCYNEIANFMQLHSSKGQGVRIVGRLKQVRWKDGNGKMSAKIIVVAEHIDLKPFIKDIA